MAGIVRSTDHGYKALLQRVFGFGRPQIAMGILEKAGSESKRVPDGEKGDELVTLIEVAGWMEFGFTIEHPDGSTTDVPARSFIRAWYDQAQPVMREQLVALMRAVVKGTRTKEQVLELLGQSAQGQIQARIADGIDPPLKASTVRRKGSSKPLINTGQLRSSVSYEVREKGK